MPAPRFLPEQPGDTASVENKKVIRSAMKVGGFTLMSRMLGLVRDTLTASAFGTSAAMSDFVVAFRIPNMFRALFGEGALSSAFVPVFMDTRRKEGDEAAWLVARKVISLVSVTLTLVVAVAIAITSALGYVPGLVENAPTVLPLTRIMLPYLLFICVTALSQAILNSFHRFSLPAFTPSLLNITWIAFVILICPLFGDTLNERIYGVAWGVFFAGIVQLAAQVPTLIKVGYRPGFKLDLSDERVTRFLKLMGPTALGQSVSQINVMVNGIIARWATSWAPASLFYAERLLYFPQGILATALGTVLLPVFSAHIARGDHDQLRVTLNHSLRTLLFVMAPASLGLLVLAEPITQLVFGFGRFDAVSVSHTATVLRFYAPGLFVFCLAKVFVPAFYAMHDTKTPFRVGLFSVGLNFSLNILFTFILPRDWKAASLAFATVVSEGVYGLTLARRFHGRMGSPGWDTILQSAGRALFGAIVMSAAAFGTHGALHLVLAGRVPEKLSQVISVLSAIGVGAAVYFAVAALMRAPEIGFVKDAVLNRRRAKATSPESAQNDP